MFCHVQCVWLELSTRVNVLLIWETPREMFHVLQEQQRSASLAHVNSMLREQLDQATSANQSLTADIHRLTADWQRAREELDAKESEWREEVRICTL